MNIKDYMPLIDRIYKITLGWFKSRKWPFVGVLVCSLMPKFFQQLSVLCNIYGNNVMYFMFPHITFNLAIKSKNPANFPWLFPRIYIHSICQFMFDLSYMSNDISFPCVPISCILKENRNTCTRVCRFCNVHLYHQK